MRPEDRGLAVENFAGLNGAFYEANPPSYFQRRWSTLLLVAARPEAVENVETNGL